MGAWRQPPAARTWQFARTRPPHLLHPRLCRVVASPRGRAVQMNAGAASATGEILLFLHADTRLPPTADAETFAGHAANVGFAGSRAVKRNVAGDDVLLRREC